MPRIEDQLLTVKWQFWCNYSDDF